MSNAMSLYKLTDDFTRYMDAETDEEMAGALADITAGQIEVKAESYCKFIASLEGFAEQCKAEADRINKAGKAAANKAARIKEHMKDCLLAANIDKVSAGTFKVSISLSPGSVAIDDPAAIPPRFLTIVPEQYVPDKNAIKAAIKNGEDVPGAHIEAGYTMRIK